MKKRLYNKRILRSRVREELKTGKQYIKEGFVKEGRQELSHARKFKKLLES